MRTSILVAVSVLLAASCRSLPWRSASVEAINLAVSIEKNLLVSSEIVDGRPARVLFGSAHSQTILDDQFAKGTNPVRVELGDRRSAAVRPIVHDLAGVADVLVGMDVWRGRAVTFDYQRQLIAIAASANTPDDFMTYRFEATPAIPVTVDGVSYFAIVDVASPDSLIVPRNGAAQGRREAVVQIGADKFKTDVLFSDTNHPRMGARILSRYLLRIDYGSREVGLWRRP
jgi:hypothetical protein